MEDQVLKATLRETSGSANACRERMAGEVPAVLYGHGEPVVSLCLSADEVHHMVNSGHHLVTLEVAGKREPAIIKELQWDTWSRNILHVDFGRVALDERVTVEVEIVPHGTPKALASGAVLTQPLYSIEVVCAADHIPDELRVEIGDLETGQSIHVRDLELPPGVAVTAEPAAVIISLHEPRGVPVVAEAEAEALAAEGEPEVIGKGGKEPEEDGKAEA